MGSSSLGILLSLLLLIMLTPHSEIDRPCIHNDARFVLHFFHPLLFAGLVRQQIILLATPRNVGSCCPLSGRSTTYSLAISDYARSRYPVLQPQLIDQIDRWYKCHCHQGRHCCSPRRCHWLPVG
ncbi:hypothetical protein BGW36DRAFT_390166, partial [Talaromyces proteolyticus]